MTNLKRCLFFAFASAGYALNTASVAAVNWLAAVIENFNTFLRFAVGMWHRIAPRIQIRPGYVKKQECKKIERRETNKLGSEESGWHWWRLEEIAGKEISFSLSPFPALSSVVVWLPLSSSSSMSSSRATEKEERVEGRRHVAGKGEKESKENATAASRVTKSGFYCHHRVK